MPCADGYFILAVGNDGQFQRVCSFAGCPELAEDERFTTNALRVKNRAALYEILPEITRHKTQQHWVEGLAGLAVPAGPVNTLDQVFSDPQVLARDMKVTLPYRGSAKGEVDLIGNPIKFSETPVEYRVAPPRAGQDSDAILEELLDLGPEARARLRGKGII
jgi:crotonobetainyl-CoA:carnitine CoA-transferase CaiB-like acyl-CoA transferase